MRKLTMLAIVALFVVSACATATLPTNATPEQKRLALCYDAQTAVVLADSYLATKTNISAQEKEYWILYQISSKTLVTQYCGN